MEPANSTANGLNTGVYLTLNSGENKTAYVRLRPDMVMGDAKAPVITKETYAPALEAAKGVVNRWMAAPELEGGMEFGRDSPGCWFPAAFPWEASLRENMRLTLAL